jgi:hypothetical protein
MLGWPPLIHPGTAILTCIAWQLIATFLIALPSQATQAKKRGLGAERVPLSGVAGGSYSGDLTAPILGRDLVVEAKARANGFARLYSWLEDRDVLIIKADRRDAIVVLPLCLAAEIAIAAERRKP